MIQFFNSLATLYNQLPQGFYEQLANITGTLAGALALKPKGVMAWFTQLIVGYLVGAYLYSIAVKILTVTDIQGRFIMGGAGFTVASRFLKWVKTKNVDDLKP